ncbi:MAG TPA: twin-arginine translocase subunit TatC [Allosphingosinicella sp.]|jgi:sec-independent protein translocase protein TatC
MRDIDDKKQPLMEHLIELRRRLIWCFLALGIAFAICFYFSDAIFAFLVQPLKEGFGPAGGRLIYTKLYEAFFVQIKVAFFAAFFVSFPIIANQIWAFVAPGLYSKEKKAFLPFLFATPVLFTAGGALAYYVVMPAAFQFLLHYQGEVGGIKREAFPSIDDYLGLVMQFIMGFGVAFLLPILLMLLERAGLVTLAKLKSWRRYAILFAFIVAALITPPDVASMCLLAIPLVLLYELTLVAIWFTERRRAREALKAAAAAGE